MNHPQGRIRLVEQDLQSWRDRTIEEWKLQRGTLVEDCWSWEELGARANFLFSRILDLDTDLQMLILGDEIAPDPALGDKVSELMSVWLGAAQSIAITFDRLERENGSIEGSKDLRSHIRQATSILTPDDAFFSADAFLQLRDRAIEDHRDDRTEPMDDDVCL